MRGKHGVTIVKDMVSAIGLTLFYDRGSEYYRPLVAGVISFGFNLRTDGATKRRNPIIDNTVMDLDAFPAFSQYPRLIKSRQVLRHIGLGGINFAKQIADVFLAITKATDDFQPHGR